MSDKDARTVNLSNLPEPNSRPNFDLIKQENPYGNEYWNARDLMPLLGYQRWENFELAIRRAITSCRQTGNTVEDHFRDTTKMIQVGKGGTRRVKDYILSRFGCYLIAQNGDSEKPEIAAAQAYFAIAARENEIHHLVAKQEQRVELRERISEGNKELNEIAYQAGVLPKNFGKFHVAGYKGLYGGLDVEAIKRRKGIGEKEELLDRLGLEELGANALRVGLTGRVLKEKHIIGEAAATQTHNQVGKEIREAIQRTGANMPEDLSAEPSIKPLIEEKKRRRKKYLPKQDANDETDPKQGTLF